MWEIVFLHLAKREENIENEQPGQKSINKNKSCVNLHVIQIVCGILQNKHNVHMYIQYSL